MVLCCKDSTIFSLSPHLCATDFPDKEHSHDFLLFFRSSSPLSVLTLVASRAAHLTFRPFLLAFVKATAHLLPKTRELFDKTPQLLAKSSLVFRNSRTHLHLIQAKSLVCPPFSHRWPCILAAILPPPHDIYPSISTCLPSSANNSSSTRSSSPHSRLFSRRLLIVLAFYETQPTLANLKVPTLQRQNASRE